MLSDESYIHQNHAPAKSWIKHGPDGARINRGSSKGKRLVIIHAITKDGPLVTRDNDGVPINEAVFGTGQTKDTATTSAAGLTAEVLWTAQQHSGD